jgi:sec-independent protein translocase protein TatB
VFGINGSEFIVLLAVAAVVLGPERLPRYTQQLTQLIRELRKMAATAQDKVREELGPEFDDVDWRALDPRQYDPRRIVRDALSDVVDDVHDPLGLGADPLGLREYRDVKDVSPGGPTTFPAADAGSNGHAVGSGAGSRFAGLTDADADHDQPLFDPDAT